MGKNMKLIVITLLMIGLVTGCSTFNRVFPDRSKDYQQAETLPDLEIPPDLTGGASSESMTIPGEKSEIGSLSGEDVDSSD